MEHPQDKLVPVITRVTPHPPKKKPHTTQHSCSLTSLHFFLFFKKHNVLLYRETIKREKPCHKNFHVRGNFTEHCDCSKVLTTDIHFTHVSSVITDRCMKSSLYISLCMSRYRRNKNASRQEHQYKPFMVRPELLSELL